MLSEFQHQKWLHFFSILDFNKNGKINIDDFIGIAENLCVLWGYSEGSKEYDEVLRKCKKSWSELTRIVPREVVEEVYRDEFVECAGDLVDEAGNDLFNQHVSSFVGEIFDYFDQNNDGFISIEEYVDLFMAYHIEVRYSGKAFTKLDLNGDELLSRKELVLAVRQYFLGDNKEDRGNWLFGFWDVH